MEVSGAFLVHFIFIYDFSIEVASRFRCFAAKQVLEKVSLGWAASKGALVLFAWDESHCITDGKC